MNNLQFYFNFFKEELWNKKWLFLCIVWGISVLGMIGIHLIPNQYTTNAGISIDTDQLLSQIVVDSTFAVQGSTRAQTQKVSQIVYSTANLRNVLYTINPAGHKMTPVDEYNQINQMRENLTFNMVYDDYYVMSYTH